MDKLIITVSDGDVYQYLIHFRKYLDVNGSPLNEETLLLNKTMLMTEEEEPIVMIYWEDIHMCFPTVEDAFFARNIPFDKSEWASTPDRFTHLLPTLHPEIVTKPDVMSRLNECTKIVNAIWFRDEPVKEKEEERGE